MDEGRLLHYYGSVQGVGFRWTARNLAESHGLSGYVCNLPDGSVELLIEGASEEIEIFLAELESDMGFHIVKRTCVTCKPTHAYHGLEITH